MTKSSSKQKKVFIALACLCAVSYLANFIILDEFNPTKRHQGVIVSQQVDHILETSCFDCHSNQTNWPWYSYLPFITNLVVYDVAEGRSELNFSDWNDLPPNRQAHKLEESIELVKEGEMPLGIYLVMHSEAELDANKQRILFSGLENKLRQLPAEDHYEEDEDDDHDHDHNHD